MSLPVQTCFQSQAGRLFELIARLCCSGLVVLQLACTNLIFQPTREHQYTPDIVNVEYDDIVIAASDGVQLHGWKLLAAENSHSAILFFHGNAENISTHFANVFWLTKYGFDVYLFDYRGFGKSQGVPDLDAVIIDSETMMQYVVQQLAENKKMVVMGHSLGASLGIYAVAHSQLRESISALVAVSGFSDYQDAAQDVLSTSWLTWLLQWPVAFTIDNSYRPLDVIEKVSPVPLLIMHSENDTIIPFYHAEKLFAAARQPKKLITVNSAHNEMFNAAHNRTLLLDYLLQGLPTVTHAAKQQNQ